jgi:uncharacterized membrane protein YphA (DoxX/SURF4 family)
MTNDRLAQSLPFAAVALRFALAAAFLSAVADRFGLWGPPGAPNVGWGAMQPFFDYTATLNPWAPAFAVPFIGWFATIAEIVLGVWLIVGVQLRWAAVLSALLLLAFGVSMAISLGPEAPLSYSVFTAATASWLLAALPKNLTTFVRAGDSEPA